ncbi:Transportin-3 [Coccomyxa sp. Obi]|nr:Transportin-3 [Coccomyxa sp. Obi]
MSRENLLDALHALNHHPDSNVKKQASVWLEQWQSSLDAWIVCDTILHDATSNLEAQYFSAQTLRTKVQRDFEELPEGAAASLRDSLVELLLRFGTGSPPVRTQLCLAVAALTAHMPPQQWGPGGSLQWLVQRLSSGTDSQQAALPCLLELLTILPQEAGSYRPAVRPERRRQLIQEMEVAIPSALQLLATILQQQTGPDVVARVLVAFSEWLKLANPQTLDGAALAQHPLVTAALEGLNSERTFDGAVDAVVELVYVTSSGGQPNETMLPLVARLVPAVMQLLPRFVRASQAAAAQAHAGDDGSEEGDDDETAKGMARLFAEVGEAYCALIATGNQQAVHPVEALLAVAAHPNDELAAMSFNFWHRLSRHLTSSFGAQPASEEEMRRRVAVFTPAFEQLVTLLRGRVRFPADWDSWEQDDRDDFKHARQDVSDALLDAAGVLGGERTLQLLTEPLAAVSAQVASGGAFDWPTAEAALYCVRAVHSNAPEPGNALLLQLFSSLPQLPAVPQLQYTAAMLLAAYADWLTNTFAAGSAADLMPQLLQMLTTALMDKEAANAAALALRHLCDACGAAMAPHLDALMALYQRIQSAGQASTSAAALSPPHAAVEEADVQQVVEALALVVSALPAEQRKAGLQALLSPVLGALQGCLEQELRAELSAANGHAMNGGSAGHPHQSTPAAGLDQTLPLIDRITIIFRYVRDPDAVASALQQVWPLLHAIIEDFRGKSSAIERVVRCPRYALKTAGKSAAGLLPMLTETLPGWFEATRHSSFLYVASELIKVFGSDPAHVQELGVLFERLVGKACEQLRSLGDFRDVPDVADDMFLLAGRGLSYCPTIVLTPVTLPRLLDAATAGVLVQHRDACCSILTFLTRLFEPQMLLQCGPTAATQITAAVVPRAPVLVRLLVAGAVGGLPSPRCADITDALVALLKATHDQGMEWLKAAIDVIPDEAATASDRTQVLSAASEISQGGAAGGRSMAHAMEELSELVRRNRRSLEAAQRALLAGLQH